MFDIPRIIFSGMTKSLGKRAFSDSLLVAVMDASSIMAIKLLFWFSWDMFL